MKYLVIPIAVLCLTSSCSSLRKVTVSSQPPAQASPSTPKFIENIVIHPDKIGEDAILPITIKERSNQDDYSIKKEKNEEIITPANTIHSSIENLSPLQFKYGILLNTPVEEVNNDNLLQFMESWYGTRYRMGGTSKSGVDCSSFTQSFLSSMYGMHIPRTSREQFQQSIPVEQSDLREGDLVFFKTRGKSVSHVGVYLRNNRFIHASSSSGVMISSLDEDYFSKRFLRGGKIVKSLTDN